MGTRLNSLLDYLLELDTISIIAWSVIALFFAVSLLRGLTSRGGAGGIGAGIMTGLAAYTFGRYFRWIIALKQSPSYISIPAWLIGIVGGGLVSFCLLILSNGWKEYNSNLWITLLFRFIGAAGVTIVVLHCISLLGDDLAFFF